MERRYIFNLIIKTILAIVVITFIAHQAIRVFAEMSSNNPIPIEEQLKDKNGEEKARIKAEYLSKIPLIGSNKTFHKDNFDIDIKELGVEDDKLKVVIEAFKDGVALPIANPLYYYNPPVKAPDGTMKTVTQRMNPSDPSTETTHEVDNFKIDPVAALQEMIAETVRTLVKIQKEQGLLPPGDPTLTFYSNNNPANTVDGITQRVSAGESFTSLRNGAGTNVDYAQPSLYYFYLGGNGVNWAYLYRSIFLFDTSSLPDDATISAATASFYGDFKQKKFTDPSLGLYASNPVNNTTLTAADHTRIGTTLQSNTVISYTDFKTGNYNDFPLNATGLGNISKTGITKLGLRNKNYDADNVDPGSSGVLEYSGVHGYFAEQDGNGTTKDPKLVVTYTTPPPPLPPWEKNIMRNAEVRLEGQAISAMVGGSVGYLFSRGSEAGTDEDKLLSSEVVLTDANGLALAGHTSCSFINRSNLSKVFAAEVMMSDSVNLALDGDVACVLFNPGDVVQGNIYSRREVSRPFALRQGVMVSGEKSKGDILERISYYNIEPGSTAAWDNSQEYKNVFMRSNILKWRDQRATKITDNINNSHFHLNPKGSDNLQGSAGRVDDENYPEGRTWYHDGDFTIDGGTIEFGGKGTIIVEGNLKIDVESLTPNNNDTDMLGFIVLPKGGSGGNVEITSKVKNLKASFFIPGKTGDVVNPDTGLPQSGIFHIQGSADVNQRIVITGSIVANGIDLREKREAQEGFYGIKIFYDNRLVTIPPPGFTREMIASSIEKSP